MDAAYDRDELIPVQARKQTIGQYFETWLRRHPRAERTEQGYRSAVRSVLGVKIDGLELRHWPVSELRRRHVVDLVDALLREKGRAVSGARNVLGVCSAMFSDALDDEVTEVNPFLGVRIKANDPRIRKARREARAWSWEEMSRFAVACGEWEPLVRVLSGCGLRLGEVLPLERADWNGDVLEIRKTAWRGRVTAGTKTDHGRPHAGRTVPLPASTRAALEAMPRRIDTRLLFPAPDGRVWDERRFYERVWWPAQAACGLTIRPHEMRHSWVSLVRAAGVEPAAAAAVAGHSVEVATRVYTHVVDPAFEAIRRAVP
jgi:integrase